MSKKTATALTAANTARLDAILNRWYRDSETGRTYTIARRYASGDYAYKVRSTDGTYGLIIKSEMGDSLDYMTPVVPVAKMVFEYLDLPVALLDEVNYKMHGE